MNTSEYSNVLNQLNRETYEHSQRVAFICRYLAEKLDLDEEVAYKIGLLHDIGIGKTAADTAKKATLAGVDVAPGERVSHPKFGEGTVISAAGSVLTIVFDLYGTKKLAKDMAPLKKV